MNELWGTTITQPSEPLTLESLMKALETLRNECREPPIEIISPQEYFRRLGYRIPLSAETLARLWQEHTP